MFSPEVAREKQITDAEVLEHGVSVETVERVPLPDGVHDWLTYKFPLHDNLGHPTLVAGLAVDITDRIRAEQAEAEAAEALRRQKTRLETLLRVAARLNSLTDRQAVLDAVCVEVRSMLGACAASVALLDPSTGALRLAASSGLSDDAQALLANVPCGGVVAHSRRLSPGALDPRVSGPGDPRGSRARRASRDQDVSCRDGAA